MVIYSISIPEEVISEIQDKTKEQDIDLKPEEVIQKFILLGLFSLDNVLWFKDENGIYKWMDIFGKEDDVE